MAVGDKAAAVGLPIVSGSSTQASDIDLEINRTRDMVADVMTSRARSTVSSTAPTDPEVGDLWFEPI